MIRLLRAASALVFLAAPALADSTLPNLTAGAASTGTDVFYCDQGAGSRKCAASALLTYMQANITASGGGTPRFPGFVVGNWYTLNSNDASFATGANPGTGNINIYPCLIEAAPNAAKVTFDRLSVRINTVGTTNVQAALYANNASNKPGTLVMSTASMATTTVNVPATGTLTGTAQVSPGVYWCATIVNDTSVVLLSKSANSLGVASLIGSTAAASIGGTGGMLTGYQIAGQTYGTWPSDLSSATLTATTSAVIPIVFARVVSAP